MKLSSPRANIFTLTATAQEVSALVGAARMTYEAMRDDPQAPPDLVQLLSRILGEYDSAVERLKDGERAP